MVVCFLLFNHFHWVFSQLWKLQRDATTGHTDDMTKTTLKSILVSTGELLSHLLYGLISVTGLEDTLHEEREVTNFYWFFFFWEEISVVVYLILFNFLMAFFSLLFSLCSVFIDNSIIFYFFNLELKV